MFVQQENLTKEQYALVHNLDPELFNSKEEVDEHLNDLEYYLKVKESN